MELEYLFQLASYVPPDVWALYASLLVITFEIAGYALLVYMLYKFIAKRDVFGFDVRKFAKKGWLTLEKKEGILGRIFSFILAAFKYGLIFPVFVFFWFAVFSIMLFVLAPDQSVAQILLISITMVSAVRIASYVKEEVAIDIVKLVALAILANFLLNPGFFTQDSITTRSGEILGLLPEIVKFVSFPILLEWLLRVLLFIKVMIFGVNVKELGEEVK